MSGNKKSTSSSPSGKWVSCEQCECQEWATTSHSCLKNLNFGPWLKGIVEVSTGTSETEDAGPGSVTVSVSAARQCGLVLGEDVVVQLLETDLPPIVRRVWVSRTAGPAAIVLSERELESRWGKDKREVSLCTMRRHRAEILNATEFVLKTTEEDLSVTKSILPLLKRHFQRRLFSEGNELVYWHFGKKLTIPIVKLLSLESTQSNIWYRLGHSTKLSIDQSKDHKEENDDVLGGVNEIIDELKLLIQTALQRDNTSRIGLPPPRGVLLFGHSGTGKTAICRHIIRKLRYHHVTIEGPAIFSKYYGETERTLANLFHEATTNEPSIILVEDVDTICPRKSSRGTEQEKRVAAAFLSGLDLLQRSNSRVFVLATAVKADSLDTALRRAGRLDRELEACVPDRAQRRALLQSILLRVPHQLSAVNIETIADAAHGYVAADILNLCAQASTKRMSDVAGVAGEKKLRLEDLLWALTVVKASAMREVLVEVPNVRWTDVGGQNELKAQLRQSVEWPLKHADRFESLGIEPPSGVLMYGPPGCSKTLIAKALATESQLNFISIKGPELFSKWVGESERAVREVFARARRVAPAVVFFDELDALGGERGGGEAGGVRERVLAQLLTELDGVVPLRGVLVLGATNRPDRIDRALLRPGRLDRLVYVPLPDGVTRAEIFRIKLSKVPLSPDVSLEMLVDRTEGYSGAEVQAVCHEAVLKALDENIESSHVDFCHFEAVLSSFKPRTPESLLRIYESFSSKNRS